MSIFAPVAGGCAIPEEHDAEYVDTVSFAAETLQGWSTEPEVQIETSRGAGAPVHRVTIWIVVADGRAYVRSVRGPSGRWYREITANPHAAVHLDGQRVPVRAEPAVDAASVATVSAALEAKYRARYPGPTVSMLREETLPTTLRLVPD